MPSFVSDPELALTVIKIAKRCLADIGLGYRPTTWRGILRAALLAEQVPTSNDPAAKVGDLGASSFSCTVVNGTAAIAISALGEEVTAMNRARLQTCLRWLDLP